MRITGVITRLAPHSDELMLMFTRESSIHHHLSCLPPAHVVTWPSGDDWRIELRAWIFEGGRAMQCAVARGTREMIVVPMPFQFPAFAEAFWGVVNATRLSSTAEDLRLLSNVLAVTHHEAAHDDPLGALALRATQLAHVPGWAGPLIMSPRLRMASIKEASTHWFEDGEFMQWRMDVSEQGDIELRGRFTLEGGAWCLLPIPVSPAFCEALGKMAVAAAWTRDLRVAAPELLGAWMRMAQYWLSTRRQGFGCLALSLVSGGKEQASSSSAPETWWW